MPATADNGILRPYQIPGSLHARKSDEKIAAAFASPSLGLLGLSFEVSKGRGAASFMAPGTIAVEGSASPSFFNHYDMEQLFSQEDCDLVARAMMAVYDSAPMISDRLERCGSDFFVGAWDGEASVVVTFLRHCMIVGEEGIEWMPSMDYDGETTDFSCDRVRSRFCTVFYPRPRSNHERIELVGNLDADLATWARLRPDDLTELGRLHSVQLGGVDPDCIIGREHGP